MRGTVLIAVLLTCADGLAEEAPDARPVAPAQSTPVAAPATRPLRKRFFVHFNLGINAYTYLGTASPAGNSNLAVTELDPSKRVMLLQLVGFGYWVTPTVRLTLSAQFVETVSGIDASKVSRFTMAGVIPWVAWSPWGGFFAGLGPLFAPRIYAKDQFDVGVFTCLGWAAPLGHGFSLGIAVQVPIMVYQRLSVAISPAVALGYRF